MKHLLHRAYHKTKESTWGEIVVWLAPVLFIVLIFGVQAPPPPPLLPTPDSPGFKALRFGPTGWDEANRGRQVYTVGGKQPSGPQFVQFVIDPFDATNGKKQTWRINAKYEKPIDSVHLSLTTDSGTTEHDLKLVEGTATSGWWETTYTMEGNTFQKYAGKMTLRSGSLANVNEAVFRMPQLEE